MQFDFGLDSITNIFILNHKINASQETVAGVPVLFYGGLNNDANSVSPGHFKDQMVALKNAGFQTISLEDFYKFMQSGTPVPAKSFLLTFEDGRKDSYYEADPVLKSLGFKAVMFVIAENSLVESHPFHLSRYELIQMRDTGRWDIESHGGKTHSFLTIGQDGEQGHFYDNKLWLIEQNRLESDAEFQSRIRNDLESSKNNIEKLLGHPVYALGFPFDDRGDVKSNYPAARSIVQSEAEKTYKMVFNGFWPRSKDGFSADYPGKDNPDNLKRINVLPAWNGDELAQTVIASGYQKLPYSSEIHGKNGWVNLSGQTTFENKEIGLLSDKGNFNSYLDGAYLWQDYNFNIQINDFDTERTLSMMFRYHDAENYYSCDFRANSVVIRQEVGRKIKTINEIKITDNYQIKKDTVLGVNVQGDDVACMIDNVPIISQSKAGLAKTGGVGLKIWDNKQTDNTTKFKYIKVYPSNQDWEALSVKAGPEVVYNFLDQGNLEAADLMLDDIYRVERYKDAKIASPIDWRIDPYHEEYWRFLFYSLQPSRHLMSAWQKTGNEVYKNKMIEIVTDFIDHGMDQPYSWDKHGAAYRTMVLVNTAGKLKKNKELPGDLDKKISAALVRHGEFLADTKNYEGDYNHGLDQAIALFDLSVNYPDLPQSANWKKIAISRLERGLGQIVDSDGILVENSPYYHFYALGKYWELFQYLQNNKISVSDSFDADLKTKIKKMIAYGANIIQPDMHVPTIGASLDSKINYTGIYKDMGKFDQNFLYAITSGKEGQAPEQKNIYYPDAGQTIMRSSWDKDHFADQTQLIFDVGAYRTNHSDLDALSFSLYGQGRALMPDSGLYTYEAGAYRDYFHGTRSHNTVVVDGKSQDSGEDGKPADNIDTGGDVGAGRLISKDNYSYQTAWHTLYDGVTHNRSIAMLEDKAVVVMDYLDSGAEHNYEQMWHLFPGAKIEKKSNAIIVRDENNKILMRIIQLAGGESGYRSVIDNKKTGEGQCSKQYKQSEGCYSLSFAKKGKSTSFVTLILLGEENTTKFAISTNKSDLTVKTGDKNYFISMNKTGEKQRAIAVDKKARFDIQNYNPAILDDMNNAENWVKTNDTGNGGSISFKTTDDGQNYMQASTPADNTYINITKQTNLDLTDSNLNFKIKVPDRQKLTTGAVYLSNDNFKNFAMLDIKYNFIPDTYSNQWVVIGLGKGMERNPRLGNWNFYQPGFDWSRIDNIRFRLSTDGPPQDISVGPISRVKNVGEAKVVIMFDDGWSSVMDAAKIMNEYDMKGNVGVIGGSVGKKSYMNVDDLKVLQNQYHWNIVSHTYRHKDAVGYYYKNNDKAGYEEDITNNIYFLEKNNINSAPNWFIYPNGRSNTWAKQIVSKYYTFARGTDNAPEFFPYADPLSVKVLSVYSDRIKPEGVAAAVRDAKKYDQTLFLMFHKFSEYAPYYYTEFNLKEFESIIKMINEENVSILTLSELDNYYKIGQNEIKVSQRQPAKLTVSINTVD
jgi:peptidoglycan/xylan/chitin deacetylase (PgdA/CDA1 family)